MGTVVCTSILVVTFLLGMSHAFFSNVRPPCFPGPPRYDSCRVVIEDLKALLEITQSLTPNMTYTCPTCTSTLNEDLIIKLVNALILSATQNCGFNGKGCCGIPGNTGGGGNTGGSGGKNSNKDPLINLELLNGNDTALLEVAGKKILAVDIGEQHGSGKTNPVTSSPSNPVAGMVPPDTNNVGDTTNTVINQGNGTEGSPVNNVNSGNTQTEQNSLNIGLVNQPSTN